MRCPDIEQALTASLQEFQAAYSYGKLPLPEDTKMLEGWIKEVEEEFGTEVVDFDWEKLKEQGSWIISPFPRIEVYTPEEYGVKYGPTPPCRYDILEDIIIMPAYTDAAVLGEGFIHEYGHALLAYLFGAELYVSILDFSLEVAYSYMEEPVMLWSEDRAIEFVPILRRNLSAGG